MVTSASDREEPVMVSALEHYSYCPRQCALIHREQTYDENVYTLKGNALHEGVAEPASVLGSERSLWRSLERAKLWISRAPWSYDAVPGRLPVQLGGSRHCLDQDLSVAE